MAITDKQRLNHILEACFDIQAFAKRGTHDRAIQLAIIKSIENIGEAARHTSDELKKKHPDVAWSQMIAMRNYLTHEYFRIDEVHIAQVVEEDVPLLIADMEKILRIL